MHPEDYEILQFRLRAAAVVITVLLLAIATYPAWAAEPAYDFAGLERLPVTERPSTEVAKRIRDDHPLVRAMRTSGDLFFRMRFLLPTRFRIAQGERFQGVIDDAVEQLVASEAGKKAVCPFAAESERDVQMYFAVSAETAKRVRTACRGYPVPPALAHRLRVMRDVSPPFRPEPLVPAKKFVFVFSESGRPEIEGYTAKSNVTYLILSPETRRPDFVRRMIAHELAISYDQLGRFGYIINPVTLEDIGVALAFGLPPGTHVFEEMPVKEVQRLQCAFRDPALRFAATAQRAFEFEDRVYDRLPPVAATGSCRQILAKNSVLLQVMARVVAWDNGYYTAACGPMAKDPAARLRQVLSRISIIESKTLRCVNREACGGRAEMSLCDVLLHPRVGPNDRDLESGGPRPRMGGWGSAEMSDSTLIERAADGNALSAEEAKRIGDKLTMPDNIDELYREEDRRGGSRLREASP